jgi:uncharacterized protein (DUF2164 family)
MPGPLNRAIVFDKRTRETLSRQLVRRLKDELDVEIAPMDAERLLDLVSEILGGAYYNQGLYDAQAVLKARTDDIAEAIAGLERAEPR